jgi:hypothetical protein
MNELTSQQLALIMTLLTAAVSLVGVWLGSKLSSRNERRKRELELLERRFEAFRQLREVIDNIPRQETVDELTARLKTEPGLLNSLKHRLVRLFGLRRELVLYLDDKIVLYIDQRLHPLFRAETGTYELKSGVEDGFARCCVELVGEVDRVEKQLVALHRNAVK